MRSLLLLLLLTACPSPKAGDDRIPLDSGTTVDTGASDAGPKDTGSDSGVDTGIETDAGGAPDADAPDGSEPTDGGDAGLPACTDGTCVPVPQGFVMGMLIDAASACPPGFTAQETPLFADLDPGRGCVGTCMCSPNATTCLGELYIYNTNAECMADTALTGGQLYAGQIDANCTAMPVREGFPGGYRLGNWTVQQSCSASGVASPSPYSWGQQAKFCVAQVGLQGCDASSVCIERSAPQTCVLTGGGATCPQSFPDRMIQWYTGLSDTRSCGACNCNASGGSCQFASISIGSDWVCTDEFGLSQSSPQACTSPYSPPARVTGFPNEPTCTPTSQQSGTIEARGQQTVCCAP